MFGTLRKGFELRSLDVGWIFEIIFSYLPSDGSISIFSFFPPAFCIGTIQNTAFHFASFFNFPDLMLKETNEYVTVKLEMARFSHLFELLTTSAKSYKL